MKFSRSWVRSKFSRRDVTTLGSHGWLANLNFMFIWFRSVLPIV